MRKHFFVTLLSFAFSINIHPVWSQQPGVAINTDGSAPAASALLDVQSTNKGFLLPRMSQAQRIAISNPEAGLLVFDTDAQKLFQHQDGVWRFLIDNSYWAASSTRNWVYNGTDSVGIGTAAPTERLHVGNGNFKISNGDIKLDNGDVLLNKSDGIIQFQSAGETKGFVQLSGNNLRIGTNLTNTEGSLIIRTHGANQVTINEEGLELTGNGKIVRTNTGDNNLIPVCYGQVREDGSVIHATPNVSIERLASGGTYYVRYPGMTSQAIAIVTPMNSNVRVQADYNSNPGGGVYVEFRNIATTLKQDAAFSFIVFNP